MWTLLEISQMFRNETMVTVRIESYGDLLFHGSIQELSNRPDLYDRECFGNIEATFEGAIYVEVYS